MFKKGDLVRMKEPFIHEYADEDGYLFVVTEVRPKDLLSILAKSLANGEMWAFRERELEKANEEG